MMNPETLKKIKEMESPVFFIHPDCMPLDKGNLEICPNPWLKKGQVIVCDKKDTTVFNPVKSIELL